MLTLFSKCGVLLSLFFVVSSFEVSFNKENGHFIVYVDGKKWFYSGEVYFRSNNQIYSTSTGNLEVENTVETRGKDSLGAFTQYKTTWVTSAGLKLIGSTDIYDDFIIFEQVYPFVIEVN